MGFAPDDHRPACAAFWNAPNNGDPRRALKARARCSKAIEAAGEIKAALWSWRPIRRCHCPRAGRHAGGVSSGSKLFVISEKRAIQRYGECGRRHRAAAGGRPWGREGRKRSPIREALHLAFSGPSLPPAPAKARPDWWIVSGGGAAPGLCGRLFLIDREGRTCFREPRGALSGFRETRGGARFRSRRCLAHHLDHDYDALETDTNGPLPRAGVAAGGTSRAK